MGENASVKSSVTITKGRDWKGWLKEGTFYVHGMVYMSVRIAVNVTMTVQPFYVTAVLKYEKTKEDPTPYQLALVPLLSYVTSLIFSLFIQGPMTRTLKNRFLPMLVAIVIIILTSLPLLFLDESSRWLIYPTAAIQGVGLAIMLNTATSLISDVIGNDSESSAFVYGCYSLFDKFANGFLLFYISSVYLEGENPDPTPIKWIMSITPIVCGIGAYILTFIGNKFFSHKLAKITGINQR